MAFNEKAMSAGERSHGKRKERSANAKKTKYKRLTPTKKNVHFITPLVPMKYWRIWHLHDWNGPDLFPEPRICGREHYGAEKCNACRTPGKFGDNYPVPYKAFPGYVHNYEGEVFRSNGKVFDVKPTRIILVNGGKEDKNWDPFDEAAGKKNLLSSVFQLKWTKGLNTPKCLTPEQMTNLANGGIVPDEARQEIKALGADGIYSHTMNVMGNVKWDFYGLDEPTAEGLTDKDTDEAEADGSYADEDNTKDADDEIEYPKTSTGKPKVAARKAAYEVPDDDEENKVEVPAKKAAPKSDFDKVPAKKAAAPSTKRPVVEELEDEEDPSAEEGEEGEEEESSEEEE